MLLFVKVGCGFVLIDVGNVMLYYVWWMIELNDEVVVVVCGVNFDGWVCVGL